MGSFGSGTIVVADESVAPIELAAKWLRDAAELSCGQCPGCREGSAWLAKQSRRLRQGGVAGVGLPAFEARLEELATSEADGLSICGHPKVAAQMTQGLLQIAPDELSPVPSRARMMAHCVPQTVST
jgi:NADH:ubiquinone oxidoreductase subunit F (NADH-binding)